MFNEMERLRESAPLVALLSHYAERARPATRQDQQSWQDRRMEQDDCTPRDLTLLHGELIAYGWLDQNTGETPPRPSAVAAGCYRVTAAGLRALKQHQAGEED